jgi:bla regulator protein blaR1
MLLYLIKLSISLSIVYLFYQLFLRRLTFYNWNRWYLLIYSLVCFVIPFINVFTIIVERPALRESAFINYIPAITQMSSAADAGAATQASGINWLQVGVIVIVGGMLFMIVRLLVQYYSLYKMRSKAVLLYDENVKLYHINEPVMPFSFGRGIYVNQHQHSEDELKDIIRHEFIHVKQRHSLDILWSELLCILNWYNPFAWLLRHDIRQNLEFIADQQVLQTGLDRKQYQYLLLKVIGVNSFSIATNFNFSSLKRRIAMMNKTQSARVHLTRFLFLLPLLVVVLLAFRNTNQERRQLQREKQLKTDTVPNAVKESRWKDVENIDVIDNRKVTILLKNGKVERYDMQNTKEREAFENKYGSLPEPPPPLSIPLMPIEKELPERPEVPEKPERLEKLEPIELDEKVEKPERLEKLEPIELDERVKNSKWPQQAPTPIIATNDKMVWIRKGIPNAPEPPEAPEKATINLQDCLNKKGYCITVADNFGERIVIVKDKDNKIVQAIFLNEWNKDKQYQEKYGEIPPVQEKYRLRVKLADGTYRPVTRGKKENGTPQVVIVRGRGPAVHADAVEVPKATGSIRAVPDEVAVLGIQKEPKTAVTAKTASVAKVKVDEVVVVGIKTEAKAAMSAKPAAEAKPRVTIKLDKPKETEPDKPAPVQPKQEQ